MAPTQHAAARRGSREVEQGSQDLIHAIGHDLAAPARRVVALLELVELKLGPALDPDTAHLLELAVRCGRQLQRQIADAHALATLDAQISVPTRISLDHVARSAVAQLTGAHPDAVEVIAIDPELPDVVVDPAELLVLLRGLLENALVYRDPERPQGVSISARPEPAGWVRVEVRDAGLGMAADSAHRAFDLWERLHPMVEPERTGAGLAICRRIVTGYGGRVGVASAPGIGSTFWFTLPAAG